MLGDTHAAKEPVRRVLTADEAKARVFTIVGCHPGINIYRLDRLADVAEFPDGVRLPGLMRALVEEGLLRQGTDSKGAPTYYPVQTDH